ncbi:sensor histidine kinase [Nocardioides solisilvae]|uniref:sensor histidine kinase n=1 Tax=Nocardioides solisilvae TaxID=1542435 RepID=UPI000D75077B|nr:HAMP domain-containing sensor histidine kinase [Nocardioides solisilvae]
MAERAASVRVRTTTAATLVVAVALGLGALALVALVRASLADGVEATVEQQLDALVAQVEAGGMPAGDPDAEPDDELVWQVRAEDGRVLAGVPGLPDAGEGYVVDDERADAPDGRRVEVVVAASLEEVEDSTDALVPPLLVGLPTLLLLVAGTTWVVTGRALAPVERIRREVEQITADALERRVPEPASRDEVHRLARTMNQMLGRLQDSHERQRRFVADASHELRSPLAGIRQTAEVAVAHPGALPEGELAEAVLEESVRLQQLVEQLLLLTRAGAGAATRQEVDLDDLVLDDVRRLRACDDRVRVETGDVGPARVLGDPVALGQVVRNLLDNAARHARTTVAVGLREAGEGVLLTVEDDGPGVPVEERERVFERFVRLDEARARDDGGSGLGLAIVRSVVEAHGGTCTVDASPRGGARFSVRLPAPPAAP